MFRSPPRRDRYNVDNAGFTLIEVLVAVAIAGLLLIPLFHVFSANINRSAQADASIEATLIAESMLETLGARLPLAPGESVADEDRFAIVASVQPYTGANAPPADRYVIPYELSVNVSWQEGRRKRSITLRTVRLAPSGAQ